MTKEQNPWSTYEVAKHHGYLNNISYESEATNHHKPFSNFISKTFGKQKVSILDFGCGNARVLEVLNSNSITNYFGLDVNKYSLQKATEKYSEIKKYKFIVSDLNNFVATTKVDVVYIDSTLTMLEEPYKILSQTLNISDIIFINRTPLFKKEEKSIYVWGGMQENSTNWKFSKKNIKKFSKVNNLEFNLLGSERFTLIKK